MEYKLTCLICKKDFDHLGSHIWHKHKILARDYKEQFGLPFKMGLISETVYLKKKIYFDKHRGRFIKNLLASSKQFQFKKGQSGFRRISEYEKKAYLKRITEVNQKRKYKMEACPVCKMQFNHMESHLFNKHGLMKASK